ncbi:MAG: hypothetical protein ACE5M4_10895, partial [Anaerolineales bacterium]
TLTSLLPALPALLALAGSICLAIGITLHQREMAEQQGHLDERLKEWVGPNEVGSRQQLEQDIQKVGELFELVERIQYLAD